MRLCRVGAGTTGLARQATGLAFGGDADAPEGRRRCALALILVWGGGGIPAISRHGMRTLTRACMLAFLAFLGTLARAYMLNPKS